MCTQQIVHRYALLCACLWVLICYQGSEATKSFIFLKGRGCTTKEYA